MCYEATRILELLSSNQQSRHFPSTKTFRGNPQSSAWQTLNADCAATRGACIRVSAWYRRLSIAARIAPPCLHVVPDLWYKHSRCYMTTTYPHTCRGRSVIDRPGFGYNIYPPATACSQARVCYTYAMSMCLPLQVPAPFWSLSQPARFPHLQHDRERRTSSPANLKSRPSPRSTLSKACTPAVCCQGFAPSSLIRCPSFDFGRW